MWTYLFFPHSHLPSSSTPWPCITRRALKFMSSLSLLLRAHTHIYACTQKQLESTQGRATRNAHNGSRGINFSHFICLLLHGEQPGWQAHNKQDIVVSGFLLWFLMPHADPYIKMTKSGVQHCSPAAIQGERECVAARRI